MTRLPYGSFKLMTPEQQAEHRRELARNSRMRNKEKRNAYNRAYFARWKKTKPFECVCKVCGNKFNAARSSRSICDKCHQWMHELVENRKLARRILRTERVSRNLRVIGLACEGLSYSEISQIVGITERHVSAICVRNGLRRKKYSARIS